MKFGFLAHPISAGHRNQVRGMDLVSRLLEDQLGTVREDAPRHHVRLPLLSSVTSATGAYATGDVRYLPYTAGELLRLPGTAKEVVAAEVLALRAAGADIVGLGGATSIVGDRGLWTAEHTGMPVTSGNSLTTYAAHQALLTCVRLLDLPVESTRVVVVGYPGSIGLAVTRLLLDDGFPLDLVARRGNRAPEALLRHLAPEQRARVVLHDDIADCYDGPRLYVTASSTGGVVDTARLHPGSVVVDVALPRDVAAPPPAGRDVLVVDGGLVTASDDVAFGDGSVPGPSQQLNGCLAETMVLALEGRAASCSLGRDLDIGVVRELGALAGQHGFVPSPLASFGRPLAEEEIARLAVHHAPSRTARAGGQQDVTAATKWRFREHVNPPMAKLFAAHHMDRVFTSARGCTLTTEDGTDYLDFVAGYGCLNLGHNHPAVTGALRTFLDGGAPTFVQYVSMPAQTAELAERLCEVAPPGLERAFFSNSGAEAVEAALKLARAGTGRRRLVYTANSYHGKTLGALSVTGRDSHRAGFGPLLPDCVEVPYGDVAALAAVIDGAAAFVVEPVQGEGGVVLPPPGYLRAAQELCRRAGAAFVLDEIQTGLGRTGAMFAAEHDGLEPDVLCVAKSLSGGLVPIAVTLSRAELWDQAYGSSNRAMLHSSTFGGGNFAAAAGLATLDALEAEKLPARAAELGAHLRAGLQEVAGRYDFIREVRGVGLMNAIEFDGDFSGAARSLADELLTRLPGDLHALVDWMPDDVTDAIRHAGRTLEATLGDLMCLRFVHALARDHRILTFVTANHGRMLRIQPPLVLDRAEADRFVAATDAVCRELGLHAGLAARTARTPRPAHS